MIKSFRDKTTKAIFDGLMPKGFPTDLAKRALRKLGEIEDAKRLTDLMMPPGNHLEALSGDRQGQYSIRISAQWRVCFEWRGGDAWNVEIVDYH